MELKNEFEVAADPRTSWEFMLTPERVVPCIPGAEFAGITDDGTWKAKAKVKLGPVSMAYRGKVNIIERDDENMRVVMKGSGTETKGKGTVKANIVSQIFPTESGGTRVEIVSDMTISGRAAQFGCGMIADVAEKFTAEFAEAMEYQLATDAQAEADSAAEEATKKAEEAAQAAAEAAAAAAEDDEDDGPSDGSGGSGLSEGAAAALAGAPADLLTNIEALIARAEKAAKLAEKSAKLADAASKQADAAAIKADAAAKRTEAAAARMELAQREAPSTKEVSGLGIAFWAIGRMFARLFGFGGSSNDKPRMGSGS